MITVDSREAIGHPQIHTALIKELGADNVKLDQLLFGDYIFTAPYLDSIHREPVISIELSTVSDVCSKLDSGRLVYQLSGAIERYDIPILLIESPIIPDGFGNVSIPGSPASINFSRLQSALFAAQSHGVIVSYGAGRETISSYILQIYRYWQKPYEEHKAFRPQTLRQGITIPIGEAVDSRISHVMGVPGIGEDKARKALELYGSLRVLYSLPEAALKLVPGWGSGSARRFTNFLDLSISDAIPPDLRTNGNGASK